MAGVSFARRSGITPLAGLLVACVALFLGGSAARGATYAPNRLDEDVPNGCTPSDRTLREAITKANNHPGPDTIVLRGGKTYVLSLLNLPDNEDLNATGDLDVLGPLTIKSSNEKLATVDAEGIDRVPQTDPSNPCPTSPSTGSGFAAAGPRREASRTAVASRAGAAARSRSCTARSRATKGSRTAKAAGSPRAAAPSSSSTA